MATRKLTRKTKRPAAKAKSVARGKAGKRSSVAKTTTRKKVAGSKKSAGSPRGKKKATANKKKSAPSKAAKKKKPTAKKAAKKKIAKKKTGTKKPAKKAAGTRKRTTAASTSKASVRAKAKPASRAAKKTVSPVPRKNRGKPSTARSGSKKKMPRLQPAADPQTIPLEEIEPDRPVIKTRLSPKQLDEFRSMLLAKRQELIGDVDNLTSEALRRSRSEAAGDLSSMPIHMADIGSDNWEQEFTLGLIDNERSLLREIDEALQRIDEMTYGICIATGKPIAVSRLRAKPWAKYCIEYARLREQGRVP